MAVAFIRRSGCVRCAIAGMCVLALNVNAGGAYAAHPLVTEDTGTQGKGGWQVEVNAEVTRDSSDGVRTRGLQPGVTLSYGVADAIDIQLGRPYQRQTINDDTIRQESNGGLDTALDLKWRFFGSDGLSLGLKPGLTLGTGQDQGGRGTGRTTAHLGVRRNNNDVNERCTLYQAAGAAMMKVSHSTRVIVDLSITTNPDPADSSSIRYATAGVIYSPQRTLILTWDGEWG
jgi:hypothetical protein